MGDQLVVRGERLHPGFENLEQFDAVVASALWRLETFHPSKVDRCCRFAQAGPLPRKHMNRQPAVGTPKSARWRDSAKVTTGAFQPSLAFGHARPLDRKRVHVKDRLDHRHVDELAFTGGDPTIERCRDRTERHHARADVAHGGSGPEWSAIAFTSESG